MAQANREKKNEFIEELVGIFSEFNVKTARSFKKGN